MTDAERLQDLRKQLDELDGLKDGHHQRIVRILEENRERFGYDSRDRLKLAFYDARSYDTEAFEKANRERFDIHFFPNSLTPDSAEATRGFRAACIFVNDQCDAPVIERLAAYGVEIIALRCAGFNHVDLDACEAHGIDVVRVPAYSPHAVAEHAIALILTLNRKLHEAYQRNRRGDFVLDGLVGFDLIGKTVGVVGTGQIGRCMAEILLAFGCRVLAFDLHPDPALAEREGVDYVPLDELFRESDIISLHVPLFPQTHHLLNREAFRAMKDGVMIINTSRGALVDTKALIGALKVGKVSAAGLDVYEEEAGIFFQDHSQRVLKDDVLARLLTFNNVLITSHQAFLTHEALGSIAETTLANLEEYVQGKRGEELTHRVVKQ